MSNFLEKFYAATGEVVLRDENGNPSVFVRHPKVNSSMFNSELLPDTVHPAFTCGETTDPAVYIGKYKASQLADADGLYSLPNAAAARGVPAATLIQQANNFGHNTTCMTIADHGLIMLMAQTSDHVVRGNEINVSSWLDGTPWAYSKNVNVGDVMIFNGWKYQCIKAHTTGTTILPPDHPDYWKKLGKAGGTPNVGGGYYHDQYMHVLTGSGPIEWYLDHDISKETDLCGEVEFTKGVRIVNGEIQIIPANRMADPSYMPEEADWKAILPHAGDNGYDLVAPGTEGTLKYNMTGSSSLVLDTVATARTSYSAVHFRDLTANAEHVPYVPSIMYELGLFPLPNCVLQGSIFLQNGTSTMYCSTHASIGTPNTEAENRNGIATLYFTPTMTTYNQLSARVRARETA